MMKFCMFFTKKELAERDRFVDALCKLFKEQYRPVKLDHEKIDNHFRLRDLHDEQILGPFIDGWDE